MKRKLIGIVVSDKCNKTRRVDIERRFAHPMYGKIVARKTVCHVHDEDNESHVGDRVQIVECRPRSKQKRWELVKVLETAMDIATHHHSDSEAEVEAE